MALYRAAARGRLDPGESLIAEHHAVLGHLQLSGLLREPDQEAISLFATDRRLIRVRSLLPGDRPPTCDERDGTVIEELPLEAIEGLVVRHQVRSAEAVAGIATAALALLFESWLLVTGTLLAAVGVLGVLHALLLPTRWVEIRAPARLAPEPWRILASRRRSARELCAALRLPPSRRAS
ncbi:MAG: hypothetical protein ACM3JH_13135 [Acidithiobacillales bacterium]